MSINSSSTTIATTTTTAINSINGSTRRPHRRLVFRPQCSSSSSSSSDSNKSRRGFGNRPSPKDTNKKNKVNIPKEDKDVVLQQSTEAPGLNSQFVGRTNTISSSMDIEFEERLEAVRRSAREVKKTDEKKLMGPIDYDAPAEATSGTSSIGFGTQIGVGAAVLVFGLVFALGDFLPSGSVSTTDEAAMVSNKLSEEEKLSLQNSMKQYEATLAVSPRDPTALEGAAITLGELGEYARAASLLQDLIKEKPTDPDALRLLGEVRYQLKDYDGSVSAYKSSAEVSKNMNFEILRGLTNALLAAEKPNEAVQVILASRERMRTEASNDGDKMADNSTDTEFQKLDPIQVDLLLGKAYSDWGHISDAVSVYDGLISTHPDDFRGYLAKGIILKENGNRGDAERMFIQARFLAPEKAKALVDRYSRR